MNLMVDVADLYRERARVSGRCQVANDITYLVVDGEKERDGGVFPSGNPGSSMWRSTHPTDRVNCNRVSARRRANGNLRTVSTCREDDDSPSTPQVRPDCGVADRSSFCKLRRGFRVERLYNAGPDGFARISFQSYGQPLFSCTPDDLEDIRQRHRICLAILNQTCN